MADVDNDQQAQDDLLKWMQMEALGLKRREKITTADFMGNKDYTAVLHLKDRRKALGGDYEPAKQGQVKIVGWNNIYRTIQHDGTAAPGDYRNVNEGLGQTHRARLISDDAVRAYTGEPDHHKSRYHPLGKGSKDKKSIKFASHMTYSNRNHGVSNRVTRGRVLKGNSSTAVPSSGDARAHLPSVPSSIIKPVIMTAGEAKAQDAKRVAQASDSFQRQQRVIQTSLLNDPRAFMASIQGVELQASQQRSAMAAVKTLDSQAIERPTPDTESPKTSSGALEKAAISASTFMDADVSQKAPDHTNMISAAKVPQPEDSRQPLGRSVPNTIPKTEGLVPLAALLSMGVNFTPEQLRLLAANTRTNSPIATTFAAPTPSDSKALAISTNRPIEVPQTTSSMTSSKALLVTAANPAPESIAMSASAAKTLPTVAANKGAFVASATIATSRSDVTPKTNAPGFFPVATPEYAIAARSSRSPATLSLSTTPTSTKVSTPVNDVAGSARHQALPIAKATQTVTAAAPKKPGMPINLTTPQSSVPTTAIPSDSVLDSDQDSGPAVSHSEILRRQREMIIGSQVYKNRYSHAAGSLVESFRKLSLTDNTPVPPPTKQAQSSAIIVPAARNAPIATSKAASRSIAVTSPTPSVKIVSASAPALRPRFIPDAPDPAISVSPRAALAPRTANPPMAVESPFGPARRGPAARTARPGGPSLPPHLMGNVASSDPGAAACAQYGTE